MKIIIEAINTPDVWRFNGPIKLRIYALQPFINSDGQLVPQGTPGQVQSAYLEVDCFTDGADSLIIPGIEIDSTVDSLTNPWATYHAELVAGGRRIPFLTGFGINTVEEGDDGYTWGEVALLRDMLTPQSIPESLNRQIAAMISSAVGQLNRASSTNTGITKLTADPVDPTNPIAVGANDPIWHDFTQGLLPATGVVPGTYTNPVIEVAEDGRIVEAGDGPPALTSVGLSGAESLLEITNSPLTANGEIELAIIPQTVNSPTSGANLATLEAELNVVKAALLTQGLVEYAIDLATLPGALLGWRTDNQGWSDNVAQASVADSSGMGNHGVQATGSKQPIAKTNIQAGKTVLRFDGVDDFLAFTTELTNIRTVYVVYKHTTPKDSDTFLGHLTSFDYTGGANVQLFNPTSIAAPVLNAAVAVNGHPDIATNLLRPTSEFQVISLVTTGNTTADSVFNDRRTALRYITGDLAEIWLYSAAHTSLQVQQAVSALKGRWGITNANPLRRRVAFDGDSITSVAAIPSPFTVRVINCLAGNCASPTPITNSNWFGDVYAVTGQTVVQMAADAVAQIDSTFNGHRAKEILLAFGGTNDLYLGASAATLQANYEAYCAARQAAGYKVVACTILPRSNSGTPVGFEAARQTFNTWLRANYLTFADALADFAADPTMGDAGDETNPTFYLDLVHPTDAGYNILAPIAATAIASI